MENDKRMKMVEQYLAYWREYIQPLVDKEPERYLHFTKVLNEAGQRLYGAEFVLELNVAIFQELSHIPSGPLSDTA